MYVSYNIWAAPCVKGVFEHAQNVQIQILMHMRKMSSGPLLSIYLFCSIQ